jgi:hypothetical protein
MLGFLVFSAGFAMATENYTAQDWQQFGCLFTRYFLYGASWAPGVPLFTGLLRTLSGIILIDNTTVDLIPCV